RVIAFAPGADGRVPLSEVLKLLAEEERISVLVEGGAQVHGSLFDQELADRVVAFIAPRVVGGEGAPSAVAGQGVATLAAAPPLAGIVTELGEVLAEVGPQGGRLRVAAQGLPADLRIGESVAVSGTCLTVVEMAGGGVR